jgi:hypothetical protein
LAAKAPKQQKRQPIPCCRSGKLFHSFDFAASPQNQTKKIVNFHAAAGEKALMRSASTPTA